MAVDKELLARYKELKAQGINVSLAELKAGVNAGVENAGAGVNVNTGNMNSPHPNLPHPGKEQLCQLGFQLNIVN